MKTGRFEESIANYEKALERDPHFIASYIGIGLDRLYMGEPAKARQSFEALLETARTSGEKRAALFRIAESWVFEGGTDNALENVEKMSAIAEGEGDKAARAGVVAAHEVPFEQRQSHELRGLIALAGKDYETAAAELEQANQQDPRVLYHLALALRGAGEAEAARAACREAAEHNGLSFNYAYVRDEAKKMLASG